MTNNDISDQPISDQSIDHAGISGNKDGTLSLGGEITKVVNTNSSEAASKVAEDKQPQASADTSEKITKAVTMEDLENFETKESTSTGNRYIIILRAGQDPLRFRSNAEFKRYLGKIGKRQASVKAAYEPQQVAGQDIIHVPKSMYASKNCQDLDGKKHQHAKTTEKIERLLVEVEKVQSNK